MILSIKLQSIILIFISLTNFIISLILGHIANYYNPNIKATYSSVIASLLGIIAIILIVSSNKYKYQTKTKTVVTVILLAISLLGIGLTFALSFYLSAWACLTWLLTAFTLIYLIKNR